MRKDKIFAGKSLEGFTDAQLERVRALLFQLYIAKMVREMTIQTLQSRGSATA